MGRQETPPFTPHQPLVDGKHSVTRGRAAHRCVARTKKKSTVEMLKLQGIQLLLIFSWGFPPPPWVINLAPASYLATTLVLEQRYCLQEFRTLSNFGYRPPHCKTAWKAWQDRAIESYLTLFYWKCVFVYSDQYVRTNVKNAFVVLWFFFLNFPWKCNTMVAFFSFSLSSFEGDGNWPMKTLCWNGHFVDYIFINIVDLTCQICDHKHYSLPDALVR